MIDRSIVESLARSLVESARRDGATTQTLASFELGIAERAFVRNKYSHRHAAGRDVTDEEWCELDAGVVAEVRRLAEAA